MQVDRASMWVQGPQQCSASFLQLLLQRLTNPNVAPITRSAAAAYLASFLARASFIPEPLLLQTLQACSWPPVRIHSTYSRSVACSCSCIASK